MREPQSTAKRLFVAQIHPYSRKQGRMRPLFDGASSDGSRLTSQPTYCLIPDTGRRQVLTYSAKIPRGQLNLPRSEHLVKHKHFFQQHYKQFFCISKSKYWSLNTKTKAFFFLACRCYWLWSRSSFEFRGGGKLFMSVGLLACDTPL